MQPYSMDLRERVVKAVAMGQTSRAVAATFGVSIASVVKWSQRFRKTGSIEPYKQGYQRPSVLAPRREWILGRLTEKPDITIVELVSELAGQGIKISTFGVWHFLRREGISFKKSLHASEQDRPDVARRRVRWRRFQKSLDPKRLVFIDETWTKTNMTRLRGWCARGQRLLAKAPHGHWKTLTFLAALRADRLSAPCVFDGPIDGASFLLYVEKVLVPTLSCGDIVIMDNLGSHKATAVRSMLRRIGAKLFFLPPYSPDLNPIEQVFSKLKALLRKTSPRSVEAVWKSIGAALPAFSAVECSNFIFNSGYASM